MGDVSKLLKHILKVPYVISADDITKTPYVERELMLIKVVCARATRGELVDMCNIFRCKVADVSEDTVTIEVSGKVSKINAMQGRAAARLGRRQQAARRHRGRGRPRVR